MNHHIIRLIENCLLNKESELDLYGSSLTDQDFAENSPLTISLNECVQLKTLYIVSSKITKIPRLDRLTKLEHLNLKDNKIKSITGLENLTNLKKLTILN